MDSQLPDGISLQVRINGNVVFQSAGRWLYPIFDLEESLQTHALDLSKALIRDKVIGKAAAFLLIRLNAGRIHGDLMSERALSVLEITTIPFSFGKCVPRIDCQTEEILADINDSEIAYQILCKRAKRC